MKSYLIFKNAHRISVGDYLPSFINPIFNLLKNRIVYYGLIISLRKDQYVIICPLNRLDILGIDRCNGVFQFGFEEMPQRTVTERVCALTHQHRYFWVLD